MPGAHVRPDGARRPRRTPKEYEFRQEERSGLTRQRVSAELTAAWFGTQDGKEFQRRLQQAGYRLARGDRRAFVVIDRAGEVHSLSRRLGQHGKEITAALADIDQRELPSVAEARITIRTAPAGTPLTRSFRNASRQITATVPAALASRPARLASAEKGAATAGRMTAPKRDRLLQIDAPVPSRYRSARAIVIAEFAAKIAALRLLPEQERAAALDALLAEQHAALAALVQAQAHTGRPQRRERRLARLRSRLGARIRPRRPRTRRSYSRYPR